MFAATPSQPSKRTVDVMLAEEAAASPTVKAPLSHTQLTRIDSVFIPPYKKARTDLPPQTAASPTTLPTEDGISLPRTPVPGPSFSSLVPVPTTSNSTVKPREPATLPEHDFIDLVSRSPTPEPVDVLPQPSSATRQRSPTPPQGPVLVKSQDLQVCSCRYPVLISMTEALFKRLERQVDVAAKEVDAARERYEVLSEAVRYRLEYEVRLLFLWL